MKLVLGRLTVVALGAGVLTLLALVTATSVLGSSHSAARPAPESPPSATAPEISQLTAIARDASAAYGESNPKLGAVVSSTRDVANRFTNGATIFDDSPCYVLEVSGHFTAMRHPRGVPAPSGTVLTVIVDAATMTPVDAGIGSTAPDLSGLGPTQNLG
jgi:hypothetical protein